VQTFIVFMPVSASVLVLNVPLSTTVVVVVAGFLSTMVHFFKTPRRTGRVAESSRLRGVQVTAGSARPGWTLLALACLFSAALVLTLDRAGQAPQALINLKAL
jgi:hypothetical protein